MSESQKTFLSKWGPLLFAILANVVLLAVAYGKNEVRMSVIEEKLSSVTRERLVSYLVTRNEYEARSATDQKEAAQNREDHHMIMSKLDRLIERRP